MKFISLIIILSFFNVFALDKEAAKIYSNLTESYKDKIKSTNPDKAVVFISSRIEPDYMDLKEVNIDSTDLLDGQVEIERPTSSSKIRTIISCRSEQGNVQVFSDKIIVSTLRFPVRVLCTGDEDNYREAYSTFASGTSNE